MRASSGIGIAVAVLLIGGEARAQSCESIATQFFKLVSEGKVTEAMDQAWATNPYSSGMADTLTNVKSQLNSSLAIVGKYRSYELLTRKEVASRYVYLSYFVAFDRQPIKFEFHCYRGNDKWALQNFKYSDSLGDEIAASAKFQQFSTEEDH